MIRSGTVKVVMTASASDDKHLQTSHQTTKERFRKRFKDPSDELQILLQRHVVNRI